MLFPTEGFSYSDTGKVFSNNSFMNRQPFEKNFNFCGEVFAIDPCENVITKAIDNQYLVVGKNTRHHLILPYKSFSDGDNTTHYRQQKSFVYSESTFGDNAIELGHSNVIDYSLIWIFKHDGKTTNYDFYDSNFLNRVKEVYPRIYPDFLTLVKRGYTVVK